MEFSSNTYPVIVSRQQLWWCSILLWFCWFFLLSWAWTFTVGKTGDWTYFAVLQGESYSISVFSVVINHCIHSLSRVFFTKVGSACYCYHFIASDWLTFATLFFACLKRKAEIHLSPSLPPYPLSPTLFPSFLHMLILTVREQLSESRWKTHYLGVSWSIFRRFWLTARCPVPALANHGKVYITQDTGKPDLQ